MRLAKTLMVALFGSLLLISGPFASADGKARFKPGDLSIAGTALAINDETGEFSTLIAALVCTDLVPVVDDSKGRLTVFAPTDAAFSLIGLNESNVCDAPELATILQYHVTQGRRLSPSVINGNNKQIKMLAGGFIFPEGSGSLWINGNGSSAEIITPDVLASNGVIHVINYVLLP